MTMLDDEVLGTLLHETGDSFAVPVTGAADILERSCGADDPGHDPTRAPAALTPSTATP